MPPRPSATLRTLLRLAALAAVLAGCVDADRRGLRTDVRRELGAGRAYAEALAARQAGGGAPLGDADVVALGYLERHRMGLGSPFRLAEQASLDPRLAEPARRAVAWALLDRALEGWGYEVDPAALDRLGTLEGRSVPGAGGWHLALIDEAVREAGDPRAAEHAVRLAYVLAAAERAVDPQAPVLAAHAAALLRDRALARRDARRLLEEAGRTGADPLALLAAQRATRQLAVEAPPWAPLPAAAQEEAMRRAPELARTIRTVSARVAAGQAAPPRPYARPLLSLPAAVRLSALADSLAAPPRTAVWVHVWSYRQALAAAPGLTAADSAAVARFVARADGEERLAAEHAILDASLTTPAPALPRVALTAAVALRALGQEAPWFPGMPGPAASAVQRRFGLAAIRFDGDVPDAWRPFYLRMLESSLDDLTRVLPSLDLTGLRVRIGRTGMEGQAMAMHDPAARAVRLPMRSGAGTIAHELAHDLDWQVARARYRAPGRYATDVAHRQPRRDAFAVAARELPSPAPSRAPPWDHDTRPAEIFARGADLYVAWALASRGRTNGALTSIQDDLLTGYGGVRTPDPEGRGAAVFARLLAAASPVAPEDTRRWLEAYGPGRLPRAFELAAEVGAWSPDEVWAEPAAAPQGAPADPADALALAEDARREVDGILIVRRNAHQREHDAPCRSLAAGTHEARRDLVNAAADARVRGTVLAYAGRIAGATGRRWMLRALYGPPYTAGELPPATEHLLRYLAGLAAPADVDVLAEAPPVPAPLLGGLGTCSAL
jgi:hypothetical protein